MLNLSTPRFLIFKIKHLYHRRSLSRAPSKRFQQWLGIKIIYLVRIENNIPRSANNMRLAVATATAERYILLYDENGVQQEKFKTKPAEKVDLDDFENLLIIIIYVLCRTVQRTTSFVVLHFPLSPISLQLHKATTSYMFTGIFLIINVRFVKL